MFAPNGAHAKKAKSVSSEPIRVTKKEKSLPPITEDEIPFEIPNDFFLQKLQPDQQTHLKMQGTQNVQNNIAVEK